MIDVTKIDFEKSNGLVPAIIQDANTQKVLMLGYMNKESVEKTIEIKKVTFFSRSKNRLWTKGEESGNFLGLVDMKIDCDNDTILVQAKPHGPTCHTGSDTCFGETNSSDDFLFELESIITSRKNNPSDKSYTSELFQKGVNKITQKVGEEAIELVIEAKDDNKELFLNESADFMYHFLVLMAHKGYKLSEVMDVLKKRNNK